MGKSPIKALRQGFAALFKKGYRKMAAEGEVKEVSTVMSGDGERVQILGPRVFRVPQSAFDRWKSLQEEIEESHARSGRLLHKRVFPTLAIGLVSVIILFLIAPGSNTAIIEGSVPWVIFFALAAGGTLAYSFTVFICSIEWGAEAREGRRDHQNAILARYDIQISSEHISLPPKPGEEKAGKTKKYLLLPAKV